MTPTILHVEDCPDIARLVQFGLDSFGFRGEVRVAPSISAALAEIERVKREGSLRLVLVDMGLPDGKGLELIRQIRFDPQLATVPIVVLSGEVGDETVSEAYSLGANCYIPKSYVLSPQLGEAIESIYRCWAEGAILPQPKDRNRAQVLLHRAIRFNARASGFYTGLARRFSHTEALVTLWLDMAVERSNRSNILAFFEGLLHDADHEPTQLTRFAAHLDRIDDCVTHIDEESLLIAHPTVDQAVDWALRLESCPSEEYMREGFQVLAQIHPGVASRIWKSGVVQANSFVRACEQFVVEPALRERAQAFRQRAWALQIPRQQAPPGATPE